MVVIVNHPHNGYSKRTSEIKGMCFVRCLKVSFILFTDDPIKDLSLSHLTYLLITLNPVVGVAHFIYLLLAYFIVAIAGSSV